MEPSSTRQTLSSSIGTSAFLSAARSVRGAYQLTVCRIGKELGVDPAVILQTSHGRRSIDTFQLYDPSKANWECEWSSFAPCLHIDMRRANENLDVCQIEGLIPSQFGRDAVEVPGARSGSCFDLHLKEGMLIQTCRFARIARGGQGAMGNRNKWYTASRDWMA